MEKLEPSCYFFDQKKPEYYRNEYLNNCKSRIRYINKIYNNITTLKSNLDQLELLENRKDPLSIYDSNLTDILKEIESLDNSLKLYLTSVNSEYDELLCRDFDKIMNNNVEKIHDIENKKGCHEICKEKK